MKKFILMCVERGFIYSRPDGWWIAGVQEIDTEILSNKMQKKIDKVVYGE